MIESRLGFRTVHVFQNLEQTPAHAAISFRRQSAFPFEIDVIDQGVAAVRARRHALELASHIFGIVSLDEHFRERILQTPDKELRLEIDRIGEETAKLFHLR